MAQELLQKRDDSGAHPSQDQKADSVVTSSHLEERVQVLNHAETFAVFNVSGEAPLTNLGAFGLFYRGCRYLKSFELLLNGQKPLLLNSFIKDRNEMLNVNLTNDEIIEDEKVKVPKGVIFIGRSRFLFQGTWYEKLNFQNFDQSPHNLTITFRYQVDFADIFEVRGVQRSRRGKMLGFQKCGPQTFRFAYEGLDHIERAVRAHFSLPFVSINESECHFNFDLSPASEHSFSLEIEAEDETERVQSLSFDEGKKRLVDELKCNRHLIAVIRTDNEQFNHWIDRSSVDFATLLSSTDEGLYPFAGVPWYNTIFGRDGLISAFFTLWTAPEIAKGVLQFLASHQAKETDRFKDAEPGKILHEMRSGEMANLGEIPFKKYYGTIDATPLFVWLAGEYFQRTGDRATMSRIWPQIKAALRWIDEYGDSDGDGYVEYQRKVESGLHNQGWKDSHDAISHADGSLAEPPIALCEVQGYVYAAKLRASILADIMGEHEEAFQLKTAAEKLKTNFNRDFWDEDLGSYCLALDGKKKPCRVLSSNPGHCLYAGIVDEDKAPILARNLLASPLFSGWGIRTLATGSRRFNPLSYHNGSVWPHDNAMIALGFSRYGLKEEVLRVLEALFDVVNRFEGARLPELFCGIRRLAAEAPVRYPVACSPQAWSVASLFGVLHAALGIEINALEKRLTLNLPVMPSFLHKLTIENLRLHADTLSIHLQSYGKDVGVNIPHKPSGWTVIIHK